MPIVVVHIIYVMLGVARYVVVAGIMCLDTRCEPNIAATGPIVFEEVEQGFARMFAALTMCDLFDEVADFDKRAVHT